MIRKELQRINHYEVAGTIRKPTRMLHLPPSPLADMVEGRTSGSSISKGSSYFPGGTFPLTKISCWLTGIFT